MTRYTGYNLQLLIHLISCDLSTVRKAAAGWPSLRAPTDVFSSGHIIMYHGSVILASHIFSQRHPRGGEVCSKW